MFADYSMSELGAIFAMQGFAGLILFSVFVLMALGLAIIFGQMGVINMAHSLPKLGPVARSESVPPVVHVFEPSGPQLLSKRASCRFEEIKTPNSANSFPVMFPALLGLPLPNVSKSSVAAYAPAGATNAASILATMRGLIRISENLSK